MLWEGISHRCLLCDLKYNNHVYILNSFTVVILLVAKEEECIYSSLFGFRVNLPEWLQVSLKKKKWSFSWLTALCPSTNHKPFIIHLHFRTVAGILFLWGTVTVFTALTSDAVADMSPLLLKLMSWLPGFVDLSHNTQLTSTEAKNKTFNQNQKSCQGGGCVIVLD